MPNGVHRPKRPGIIESHFQGEEIIYGRPLAPGEMEHHYQEAQKKKKTENNNK